MRLEVRLSLWDEKSPTSTSAAKSAGRLRKRPCAPCFVSATPAGPREVGEAAFYGPKDRLYGQRRALDRAWQLATIQLDFNLPERFDLEVRRAADGQAARPVMHRAVLGSVERFMSVLIEHYAGAFPVWLSPVQAVVVPIADRHNEYAQKSSRPCARRR